MTEIKQEELDDSYEGEGNIELLPYEQKLLLDTMDDDTLFIFSRGLGIERMFLHHLVMYSDQKLLYLVLNTNPHDEAYFVSQLQESGLKCQPKLITSEVSTKDRESIYLEGGVQFITSRILLVDLLTKNIPIHLVAGILIYRANRVLQSFQESFILRLYREQKKNGHVKAFSDNASSFSSLGQLQRVVDRLYVKKVVMVPRFHEDVLETLSQNLVIEWNVTLPPVMKRVHGALHNLIKVCMNELRQCSYSAKKAEDEVEYNVGVYAYAITAVERQLAERRSFISEKQQRLLGDLELLRELLRSAEDMDMASVLQRLNVLKNDRDFIDKSSGWILSQTAGKLMLDLKQVCGAESTSFQAPPKWEVLKSIIDEIKEIELSPEEIGPNGPSILLFTSSDNVCRQIGDLLRNGKKFVEWACSREFTSQTEPPKREMWPLKDIQLYMRSNLNSDGRAMLKSDLQKNQKVTARATRKKRKAAEDMVGSTSGGKQTNIVQFGILQYKKKKADEASTSTAPEVKEEPIELDDDDEQQLATKNKKLKEFESVPFVVTPIGERYNLLRYLEEAKPNIIILYNSDITTVRQLEIYKACNPNIYFVVHQLMYTSSTEEDRYLTSVNVETRAFSSIVKENSKLLIPRTWDVSREEPSMLTVSTRDGGGRVDQPPETPSIVVDMREFNSELPTILYKKGYDVKAATLEVADYVLTPGIAVERKALDDLTQSLQSGRVFKQIEQMLLHYANTFLLVESNRKFESKIVNGGPFQGELTRHCKEIRGLLCALIRSFPKMKLLWSLSPTNSAEYFAELKIGKEEPNMEKAVSLRGDALPSQGTEEEQAPSKKKKINNGILRQLTTHLPEMGRGDVLKLMGSNKITTIKDLLTMDATDLHSVIENHSDRVFLLANHDFSQQE